MAEVWIAADLPPGSTDPLLDARHDLVDTPTHATAGVVCPITVRIDRTRLATMPTVRVVANVAVGYDNIDVAAATSAGVVVCNTPGVLDETTADLAFTLILAASRLASTAEADLRGGRWPGWEVNQYLGRDIHGATLGLVGFGRIGRAVGRRGQGFGMTVLHHTRHDTGEPGWVGHLDDLLRRSDIVSLHVPLTPETDGLLSRDRLAQLKSTAVLVNTARGQVLDEDALAEALEAGRLHAAGLDVFRGEPAVSARLLAAPRTVLTPHIGSASVATRTAMARMSCQAVADVLAGRRPAHPVNPAVVVTPAPISKGQQPGSRPPAPRSSTT